MRGRHPLGMQGKFPSVLGSAAPLIKRADLGDKGVYYRAMVGPVGSPDEASQFCGSLKSAGGQCVVQRNNGDFLDPWVVCGLIGRISSRAFITGISGLELNSAERDFIRAERPWALFYSSATSTHTGSSCCSCGERDANLVGEADAPILIDQEGGRVQRLGRRARPVYATAGAVFGALYDIDPQLGLTAARLSSA